VSRYTAPVPLLRGHEVDEFLCASVEQTDWLRNHALQAHAMGTARVFVVTEVDSAAVVAYYAWRMSEIRAVDAPARLTKGAGRYPQSVVLLARLGVHVDHAGRGLGAGLLQDVLARTLVLVDQIGCRALLVHAEDGGARGFYTHLIPEFEQSPTDELHLVLLMKDIRKTLGT
jgi:GNAT superfamily N-acetyltransferase